MGDFYRCIDFIIAEEGGYANHPADPGARRNTASPSALIRSSTSPH
jgi:lysozyme family protein